MGDKSRHESYGLVLWVSICLNVFFFYSNVGDYNNLLKPHLSWSRKAAEEAEAVAAVSCSGHGRAYLDGSVGGDGELPVCECNSCFHGPVCSHFSPNCSADATSGDPTFLEPFWMQNGANIALVVSGWHRMSYIFDTPSYVSTELENRIRKLPNLVRNAVTDGRYIIFGSGSIQLLNAAVYALSMNNNLSFPANVVASIPYYSVYRAQTEYFNSVNFEFRGDAKVWKDNSDNIADVIEFVTSPNNPDGKFRNAVIKNSSVIHNHAYYWPHYTAIAAPADEDLMLFTLSKLTGHAGSKFGSAVIKDKDLYEKMSYYIAISEMGVSRDTQLRALKLLKVMLEGNGRKIFEFAHEKMRERWEKLSQVFSVSKRFSLQQIPPQYCNFTKELENHLQLWSYYALMPAYAWIKCERKEDKDCNAVLKTVNIVGREGSIFSDQDNYVRLSLIKRQDDFDLLLQRITNLISQEDGAKMLQRSFTSK